MEEVQESMQQMQQLFQSQMDKFQNELDKTSTSSSLVADFNSFKNFILKAIQALQTQVQALARSQDNMEMHTRRKMLLLHGLPESSGEVTLNVVVKTVVEKLKIADFSPSCVSRCHRMGRVTLADKPRPILVKICDMTMRSKIWQTKTNLKGTGITMSEFLTKSRHDVFMAARQKFGVTKCWTRDGSVFVLGPDGSRHRVYHISDLDKISVSPVSAPNVGTKQASATTPKDAASGKSKRTVAKK